MKKTSSKYDRDLARVITKSFPFWTTFSILLRLKQNYLCIFLQKMYILSNFVDEL